MSPEGCCEALYRCSALGCPASALPLRPMRWPPSAARKTDSSCTVFRTVFRRIALTVGYASPIALPLRRLRCVASAD